MKIREIITTGTLMKFIVATFLLSNPFILCAAPVQNSEIFTPESLNSGMSLDSDGYHFEIMESEGAASLVAKSQTGAKKIVKIQEAGFSRLERLFYTKSHACGISSVDVIIQLGPDENDDIKKRNYYRIVFSKDIKSVISEFFDPSIAAANAVLPLQTVENLKNNDTKDMITCEGTKPVVKQLASPKRY
ncbi:hypothetical protein ACQR5T_00955 [Xanthomonas oryzae pv. oryzicola]|uniref:hypothetical protein n=1 Tax=Xanthomonas oryzae TaxID=347 RepID=UPI003D17DBAC